MNTDTTTDAKTVLRNRTWVLRLARTIVIDRTDAASVTKAAQSLLPLTATEHGVKALGGAFVNFRPAPGVPDEDRVQALLAAAESYRSFLAGGTG